MGPKVLNIKISRVESEVCIKVLNLVLEPFKYYEVHTKASHGNQCVGGWGPGSTMVPGPTLAGLIDVIVDCLTSQPWPAG